MNSSYSATGSQIPPFSRMYREYLSNSSLLVSSETGLELRTIMGDLCEIVDACSLDLEPQSALLDVLLAKGWRWNPVGLRDTLIGASYSLIAKARKGHYFKHTSIPPAQRTGVEHSFSSLEREISRWDEYITTLLSQGIPLGFRKYCDEHFS